MSDSHEGPHGSGAGMFCWNELATRDVEKAKAFYTTLLGWTVTEMDMGPAGVYSMFMHGDKPVGGCFAMHGPQFEHVPPHWGSYIAVENVDASLAQAKELGAEVLGEPHDIPGIGRMCVIRDPSGAVVSLFQGTGG